MVVWRGATLCDETELPSTWTPLKEIQTYIRLCMMFEVMRPDFEQASDHTVDLQRSNKCMKIRGGS